MLKDLFTINKRFLGKTDIAVTPIGLGVMQMSGGAGFFGRAFPVLSQAEKTELVKAALEGGINWFDTAEVYGFGLSERSLAQALQTLDKKPGEVVIATKWWPMFRTARNIPRSIGIRLQNLHPYPIDLYYIHQPFSFSSPEAEMNAMAALVEGGKIRSIGVSNFNAKRMRRAYQALAERGLKLAANQVEYSLVHRQIESDGTLETAQELGVTIVAYTPLGYGLLTGVFHKDPSRLKEKNPFFRRGIERRLEASRNLVETMEAIGQRYGATPGQVALNWLINRHGDSVVAIPGATKVSQVQQAAGTMQFTLDAGELEEIDRLSQQFR